MDKFTKEQIKIIETYEKNKDIQGVKCPVCEEHLSGYGNYWRCNFGCGYTTELFDEFVFGKIKTSESEVK